LACRFAAIDRNDNISQVNGLREVLLKLGVSSQQKPKKHLWLDFMVVRIEGPNFAKSVVNCRQAHAISINGQEILGQSFIHA